MKFHARNRYIFLIALLFLLVSAFFFGSDLNRKSTG